MRLRPSSSAAALVLACAGALQAQPVLVLAAGDQTSGYADGRMFVRPRPAQGALTVLDFSRFPPQISCEEGVPCSVIGPPTCVAASADGKTILVASAMKADPRNPSRLAVDRRLTRLEWSGGRLRRLAQVDVGLQPSGVAIATGGGWAYVTLRAEGAIATVDLSGDALRVVALSRIAKPADSLSHFALAPAGGGGLASLHDKGSVLALSLAGGRAEVVQEIRTGPAPYDIKFFPGSRGAAVGDSRDNEVEILERSGEKWTVSQHVPVGRGPEGVAVSPDGRWIAVSCFDGANLVNPRNPWYRKPSMIYMLARNTAGAWAQSQSLEVDAMPQSAVFTPDGRRLVAGEYGLGDLRVFELKDGRWADTGLRIRIPGQPAALASAGF